MAVLVFSKAGSLLVFVVFSTICYTPESYTPCYTKMMRSIPADHLMSKLAKPIVLGHRGNPVKYQENTYDGITSLLETNADGFELDIYMSKDEKLVVFHDDNAMKLTGVNKTMWETTADELTKIEYPKTMTYNGNVFNYTKRRPIPLLRDVLSAMKDSGKLLYLEIKSPKMLTLDDSYKVGRKVAQLVTEMGLVNQASIVSFDPIKSYAAYLENPDIPNGFFYNSAQWLPQLVGLVYQQAVHIPGMATCINRIPNGTEFIKAIFETGDLPKGINASFLDMDYVIYDNPLYSNNTFQTFRTNYSPNISAGAYTVYKMENSKEVDALQDAKIDNLLNQGVQRLLTDDPFRLLRKLGRPWMRPNASTTASPTSSPTKSTASNYKTVVYYVLLIVFVMALVYTDG